MTIQHLAGLRPAWFSTLERICGDHNNTEDPANGSANRSPRRTHIPARWISTVHLALLTIAFAAGGASAQLLEKKTLSLTAAKKMAAAAEAEAARNKWAMVIAMLDDSGHLIYLEHMDGAQIGSIEVARGKAAPRCALDGQARTSRMRSQRAT